MENINVLHTILIVLVSVFSVLGGIWGFFKIFFSYRSRFLFITNCQILHRSIWADISKRYNIKQNGPQDHAFRPLVLLPHTLRRYSNIPNGAKAILECVNPNKENNLRIIAEVYWIPDDMTPWNTINHPVFSLVLRRYFGIERPLYQDEDTAKGNWIKVSHSLQHLDPLHRRDETDGSMIAKKQLYRILRALHGPAQKIHPPHRKRISQSFTNPPSPPPRKYFAEAIIFFIYF